MKYLTATFQVDDDSTDIKVNFANYLADNLPDGPVRLSHIGKVTDTVCGHPEYRDGGCGEMSCSNYTVKREARAARNKALNDNDLPAAKAAVDTLDSLD